jgi:hypothetical protein
MEEVIDQNFSNDEIWKNHVLSAQASQLSDVNYCKKHGLSVWSFTKYKKKLGFTKPRAQKPSPKPAAFVRAQADTARLEPPVSKPSPAQAKVSPVAIDPVWLASFVTALMGFKK